MNVYVEVKGSNKEVAELFTPKVLYVDEGDANRTDNDGYNVVHMWLKYPS